MKKSNKFNKNNEQGSVLIVALVILVLLTLIGISATRTSEVEILIAVNEKEYIEEFYIADSAWREGVEWLNTKASVPQVVNTAIFSNVIASGVTSATTTNQAHYLNIKNFGGGAAGTLNEAFPINSQDNSLGTPGINYWYRLAYVDEISIAGDIVAGSGKNYRRYNFRVNSVADETTQREIEITASKVFKTGY